MHNRRTVKDVIEHALEGFSDIDDTLGPLLHFFTIRMLSVAERVPLLTGT